MPRIFVETFGIKLDGVGSDLRVFRLGEVRCLLRMADHALKETDLPSARVEIQTCFSLKRFAGPISKSTLIPDLIIQHLWEMSGSTLLPTHSLWSGKIG